jgi:hypothetical protein
VSRTKRRAAVVYAATASVVVAFQLLLAAGAPLGAYAMGGGYPGRFPPALRIAAVAQAALISMSALVILARSGLALRSWSSRSHRLAWFVAGLFAISFMLNLITPSARERAVWAPVALTLLVCSMLVARRDGES